jgi:lipoprotein LpqH
VKIRNTAVAGALVVALAGVAGCTEQEVRSQAKASVTIDGKDQGQALTIRCNQLQSSWFLEIGDTNASATAIVTVAGDKATAETVQIRGFGGFTGSNWQDTDQSADASLTNRTFTITGTASGMMNGDPKAATAKFKIVARC